MKKAGRKYPNRLADSCRRSSVNQMAAGLGLSWCIMDFFSCLQIFKHTDLNSTSLAGCRTWCPTDLQHLCCKALINKNVHILFYRIFKVGSHKDFLIAILLDLKYWSQHKKYWVYYNDSIFLANITCSIQEATLHLHCKLCNQQLNCKAM